MPKCAVLRWAQLARTVRGVAHTQGNRQCRDALTFAFLANNSSLSTLRQRNLHWSPRGKIVFRAEIAGDPDAFS